MPSFDRLHHTLTRLSQSRKTGQQFTEASAESYTPPSMLARNPPKDAVSVATKLKAKLQSAHEERAKQPPVQAVPKANDKVLTSEQVCQILGKRFWPGYDRISVVERMVDGRKALQILREQEEAARLANEEHLNNVLSGT